LTRRILQPLHMSDTAMTLTPNMREKLAPGYLENGAPSKPWTFGDLGAAGGLYSNMRDMLRYLEANLAAPDGPLGPALAMAQKPRAADDSPHGETRVGLVWQTNVTNGNTFKNGQVGGYHAFIMLNRARRMGIVVLANVADSDVDTLALHLVYPTIVAAPLPPGFAPASAGEVSSVTARAKDWFHQLQSGNVDRAQLTPDFAARLTPQFLQQVRTGVAALGDPGGWVYLGAVKQGDVTIYTYRIRLGGAAREWSVGLAPDGKIAGSLLH
jgi:CubicO group peptidase (beta-lactamase class C family)